jgi:RHS repeat-associated protein
VLNSVYTDAFGATAGTASGDPYSGFGAQAGYYTDPETGLTLCGHRFYDAGVGRWLNRDPIGFAGGINLYQGFGNSPTNFMDPSGLIPWQQGIAIIGGATIGLIGGGVIGAIEGGIAGNNLYHAVVGAGTAQGKYDGGEIGTGQLAGAYWNLGEAIGDLYGAASGPAGQVGTGIDELLGGASGGDGGGFGANMLGPRFNPLGPGPYAGGSVYKPAGKPGLTAAEQRAVDALGNQFGCHTCGASTPGTKSGHWIGDHQLPKCKNPNGPWDLYPHCNTCKSRQGGFL